MKTKSIISVMALALLMTVSSAFGQVGDFFYDSKGNHISLPVCDSLVYIKHTPDHPDIGGEPFIQLAGFLADNFTLHPNLGDAYIYELLNGVGLDEAISSLREMPEVAIVNPVIVFDNPFGLEYITEQFIAQFHYDVPRSVIDSLNAFYHVKIKAVAPDFRTQYLLEMTRETGTDGLLISQVYFETGLCMYAQPNIVCTPIPGIVPGDGDNAVDEVADFYYTRHGDHITLPLSDSLVYIWHDPAYPDIAGAPFILAAGFLAEDYDVLENVGASVIYRLQEGADLAAALTQLRTMPEAAIVNPVVAYQGDTTEFSYLTDKFIARFHNDVAQAVIDSINDFYHVAVAAVDEDFPTQYLLRMTSETQRGVLEISQTYFESGLCQYAEPNLVFQAVPDVVPNDTYYGEQWSLNNTGQAGGIAGSDIDAERAWEITEGDDMPVVAVIDYGFQLDHEDLAGVHVWWPYDAGGDYVWNEEPDTDPSPGCQGTSTICWHGTAMAGIISARMNNSLGLAGIAPGCRLTPIKFCDNRGSTSLWSICEAFRHTRRFHPKVNVASCSWGYRYYHESIEAALDTTYNHGVLILFSAGNVGEIKFPATSPWVTAVGATTNRDSVWSDSTGASGQGAALDLVAPGVSLPVLDLMGSGGYSPSLGSCSGNGNYACGVSGSSIACAEAAATAGLLLSRRYDLADGRYYTTQDSLQRILFDSAEDEINPADPPGWDITYGHGRLNAYRALLSVIRGDVNNDGTIDPVDIVLLVNCIYKNWCNLQPEYCVGDCDCSGTINPVDAVYLVNHVYKNLPLQPICTDFSAE